MILDFSPEDGRKDPLPAQKAVTVTQEEQLERVRLANLGRLQELINAAMVGLLPRDRELRPGEAQKLAPAHINMVLDFASGKLNRTEIAEQYDYTPERVGQILNHPDSQTLISTVLSMATDKLTDMQARLKHLAPEALNVKVELMRTASRESERNKAASDILLLAGYGGRNGGRPVSTPAGTVNNYTNIQNNLVKTGGPTLVLGSRDSAGLVKALSESLQVAGIDYQQHVEGKSGEEIIAEHRQLSESLQLGAGHTVAEGGASPSPSPDSSEDFTVQTGWENLKNESNELEVALEEEKESEREREVA